MLVQQFLRDGGTLEDLEQKYAIKSKRHGGYPQLVSLKYNMIDSPMGEEIVQECRGLILDSEDNWNIVAYGFRKFFNSEEGHAAKIDYKTAKFQEKVDGSLVMLYLYRNLWNVATSGTPDAAGEVNGNDFNFRDLFWRIFKREHMDYPCPYDFLNFTFMFELTSPYNRVVVVQPEAKLTFLGARNNINGLEYNPVAFLAENEGFTNWVPVKEFPLQTLDDAIKTFSGMDPCKQEGYVVVDADFNRIKVKHPGYLALHHMRGGGLNPKRIIEVLRAGETSELLAYFPEWTQAFKEAEIKYLDLILELDLAYEALKDIGVQKDFALQAVTQRLPGCLFALRKGSVKSVKEYLADMQIDHLLKTLEMK